MRFASLGSGSKGNGTVVQAGASLLLIDCGFSVRETTRRLALLGLEPSQITAILVTHEHSDHSAGVAKLSRKFQIPVYLTHGTAGSGRIVDAHELCCFNCDDAFEIDAVTVQAVAVPHDAAEPCQYRISWEGRSLGILTDLGCITPHVINQYRHCDSLILEFNHDTAMLEAGAYPQHLKRRVGGDWGHLNNRQAAQLLRQINSEALRYLVIAHISEKNNDKTLAERELAKVLPDMDKVIWAQQAEGFDWLNA